jgi:integrase
VFEVALEEDRIAKNPVQGISVPKWDRREPRFLTLDKVDRIAAAAPPRYRTLIYFLAYTGLRIGEASALRVHNLDLTRSVARCVESSPEVSGRKITGDTKTRKARAVHIGPLLRQMLKDHLMNYGRLLDPNAFVFTGDRDVQIRQSTFRPRVF